ncbi:MAG TPA: aspartyl protease family protein [Gemmatimonadales bacterium]|nr:aspartyl protease family protein [Gemmatimonadales bacterium]
MRPAARVTALALCLTAACWHGSPLTPPVPVATVPFDAYGGAIYIPGVIDGDSAWLMLDTGLSHTGLDRDWAATAGVPTSDTIPTAIVRSLRIGELELSNYRVALYSLDGLSRASGRAQRGLVGHDVLQRFAVEIDYELRRVRLYDGAKYYYQGDGASVRFTPDADLPLLRASVKIPGRRAVPARLLLDTGASGLCVILTAPFGEQHGLSLLRPAIAAPIGTGLVGELHGFIVRLQELRLGGVRVPFPTTGVGGEHKGFLGRTDIDGVVGNSVFEGSRLIVDYARHRAIVERAVRGTAPTCDYDMSGLRLVARGPGLKEVVVDYVVPQSPAADAGVRAGDQLLLIDGHQAGEVDLSDVRQYLRIDGAVRQLVFLRDADTIRVAVKLRRLL